MQSFCDPDPLVSLESPSIGFAVGASGDRRHHFETGKQQTRQPSLVAQ